MEHQNKGTWSTRTLQSHHKQPCAQDAQAVSHRRLRTPMLLGHCETSPLMRCVCKTVDDGKRSPRVTTSCPTGESQTRHAWRNATAKGGEAACLQRRQDLLRYRRRVHVRRLMFDLRNAIATTVTQTRRVTGVSAGQRAVMARVVERQGHGTSGQWTGGSRRTALLRMFRCSAGLIHTVRHGRAAGRQHRKRQPCRRLRQRQGIATQLIARP